MARVRLLELKLEYERVHGSKPVNKQIAAAVFKGTKSRTGGELATSRQNSMLARWNTGKEEPSLTHLRRLAEFFGVTDLNLLTAP